VNALAFLTPGMARRPPPILKLRATSLGRAIVPRRVLSHGRDLPPTARIHRRPWRRCGVGARGARAASAAGDRVSELRFFWPICAQCRRFSQWIERVWPRRGTKRSNRKMADDLVRRRVAIIVAGGDRAALATKAATATIPIVFMVGIDPVAAGIVPSLGRPGGNLTGVSILIAELTPKRVDLLHDLIPTASTVGVLINPRGVR